MSHPHPELSAPGELVAGGLRITPLGGLGEVGRNMTVFEYDDRLLIVDCGVLFPEDHHPGVDLILPDFDSIRDRLDAVEGLVLTHGHEDHIGATPYLLRERGDIPLVGSQLTLALLDPKLREHRLKETIHHVVKEGDRLTLGPFELEFVAVNHSIPDSLALAVRTPAGTILHTGDFKADQLPPVLATTAVLKLSEQASHRFGLPRGVPVAVGAADGPLGNLGTGAITPGVAGLSLGTSGAVRMVVSKPSFDAEGRLFCYALTDDRWVLGGAVNNGGSVVRWAAQALAAGAPGADPSALGGEDADRLDEALLEEAAGVPAGSAGLLCLPYLLGERAPWWRSGRCPASACAASRSRRRAGCSWSAGPSCPPTTRRSAGWACSRTPPRASSTPGSAAT